MHLVRVRAWYGDPLQAGATIVERLVNARASGGDSATAGLRCASDFALSLAEDSPASAQAPVASSSCEGGPAFAQSAV